MSIGVFYIHACLIGVLLLQELAKQIDDYTATYGPDDQLEWSLVLGEIRAFIEVTFHLHLCSAS